MRHIINIGSALIVLAVSHALLPDYFSGPRAWSWMTGWLCCYGVFGWRAP